MNNEWLMANWAILAGAGALFVLILVLVAVLTRRMKPGSATKLRKDSSQSRSNAVSANDSGSSQQIEASQSGAEMSSSSEDPVELSYQSGREMQGGWVSLQGGAVALDQQTLRLSSGANAISVRSAPVAQGDEFLCEYEVRLVAPARNGGPVNFHVGAVVRDAAGEIVRYWIAQEAFSPDETVRRGSTTMLAPERAATVHIGAHGSWLRDKTHGDGVVEFAYINVRSKSRSGIISH